MVHGGPRADYHKCIMVYVYIMVSAQMGRERDVQII